VRSSSTAERVLVRVVPVLVAMALCGAALAAVAGGRDPLAGEAELLPDLDQELPWDLEITGGGHGARRHYRLGFGSAVRNVGDGPLTVSGRRDLDADPTMTADQLIELRDAPAAVVEGVGRLRYTRSPDHEHWHLLGFERYELRRAGRRGTVVVDHKTGFCLGDRYRARGPEVPMRQVQARYTRRCGLGQAARLGLVEGISAGWGDDYPANLEGQSLRITGLAAGRYVLVHRVNVGRRLRETDYSNNASSLLLRLRWRAGAPRLRVLRRCPDTAYCVRPVSI
jgi:Lysyl oxidase